jgi:glutamate-1-semialdehyde 2,1-aminomutase
MAAMDAFLTRLSETALYAGDDERWDKRAQRFNERFAIAGLPLRIHNLSSIWTVCYAQAGRYNWLLQYYLRAHGIALSWVGTGRIVWSLNYTEEEVDEVLQRFVAAAKHMQDDGYFWSNPALTNASIQRQVARDVIASYVFPLRGGRLDHPDPPRARALTVPRATPTAVLDGRA